jgi:hypothetical protein
MGYTPPRGTEHQFRYWITEHAVDRFRERAGDGQHAAPNKALAQLLDARLFNGFASGRVAAVVDSDHPDKETRIVEVEAQDGTKAVVVMRPHKPDAYPRLNCFGDPGRAALAAITVLTPEMAASNYTTGRWKVPMQRPFAEKLRDLPVAPAKTTLTPTGPQRPVAISASPKNEPINAMPSLVSEKLCPRCKTTRAVSEYSKCSNSKDGLQSWCKSCQRSVSRSDREEVAAARADAASDNKPSMPSVKRYEIVRHYFLDDPERSVKDVVITMLREHGCTVGKEAAREIREAIRKELTTERADSKTVAVEPQPQVASQPEPMATVASELVSAINEERQAKLAMETCITAYGDAQKRVAGLLSRLNDSRA